MRGREPKTMGVAVALAALGLALAACDRGGGGGEELAGGRSDLNAAQIDAALGPEDQSDVQDAADPQPVENWLADEMNSAAGNNVAEAPAEQEQ